MIAAEPRKKYLDADYRKDPKTDLFCCKCQRDIRNKSNYRMVHIVDGGHMVLHPEDEALYVSDGGDMYFFPIGPDCARQIGLEWTHPAEGFATPEVSA